MVESKELLKNLQEFQKGNKEAFHEVYVNTDRILYQTIYLLVHSKEVAEDLMQETYIRVLEHDWLKDKRGNVLAYFITIAKNLAFNYLKKHQREEMISGEDESYYFHSHDKKEETPLLDMMSVTLKKDEMLIVYLYVMKNGHIKKLLNYYIDH